MPRSLLSASWCPPWSPVTSTEWFFLPFTEISFQAGWGSGGFFQMRIWQPGITLLVLLYFHFSITRLLLSLFSFFFFYFCWVPKPSWFMVSVHSQQWQEPTLPSQAWQSPMLGRGRALCFGVHSVWWVWPQKWPFRFSQDGFWVLPGALRLK